jgi:hypothetical protein
MGPFSGRNLPMSFCGWRARSTPLSGRQCPRLMRPALCRRVTVIRQGKAVQRVRAKAPSGLGRTGEPPGDEGVTLWMITTNQLAPLNDKNSYHFFLICRHLRHQIWQLYNEVVIQQFRVVITMLRTRTKEPCSASSALIPCSVMLQAL